MEYMKRRETALLLVYFAKPEEGKKSSSDGYIVAT